jgi:hypothetical protein
MTTVEKIVVSYSELDTFRQCPLKHFLAYKMRYKKPAPLDSALGKGSLYHKVMEAHMRAIKVAQERYPGLRIPEKWWKQTLDNIRDEEILPILIDPETGEPYTDVHDLILWMYDGYVQKWGVNPEWIIVAVEHNLVIPLRDERGRRSSKYFIKMKIDLLVRERATGALWVVDHKSGANLPTQMDLEIDDQFGLYSWGMSEVGKPVQGSIHLANRTQRNKSFMPLDTRMGRTYLNRSRTELKNLALDAFRAARCAYPPKGSVQALYSSPDPRTCSWKCDFKEPHLLMRSGRKVPEIMAEYGFVIDRTRH